MALEKFAELSTSEETIVSKHYILWMWFPYASILQGSETVLCSFAICTSMDLFAIDYRPTMSPKGNDISSLLGSLGVLTAGTKSSSMGQLAMPPVMEGD